MVLGVIFRSITNKEVNFVGMFQASEGRLPESQARKMFQQIIDAVSYCHDHGIYHRDLKVS